MRGRLKNHGGMAAILSDFYSADYDDEYMAYKDVQRNNNISREKNRRQRRGSAFWIYSDLNQVTFDYIVNNDGFFPSLAIQFPHRQINV